MIVNRIPLALLAMSIVAAPQSPLTFEAASVKSAVAPAGVNISGNTVTMSRREDFQKYRSTGGPGTDDPSRIHYPLVSLKGLLIRAYDSYVDISGPGWLDSTLVAVDATMPAATTKEQFKEMLRNLIADRFKLKYHVDTKEVPGLALMPGKNGPKLKESADQSDAPPKRLEDRKKGADGFIVVPEGAGPLLMVQSQEDNRTRIVGRQQTMAELVRTLGSGVDSKVTDMTGLTAKYDFTVTFAGHLGPGGMIPPDPSVAADPVGLPDIFTALQSQLGLKLERRKVTVEVLVVDHMEKVLGEN